MADKPEKYDPDYLYSKPTPERLKSERQAYKVRKKFSALTNKQQDAFLASIPAESKDLVGRILRGLKKKGKLFGIGAAVVSAGAAAKKAYDADKE